MSSASTRTRLLRRLTDLAAPWGLAVTCTREEGRNSPWWRLTMGPYFGAVRFDDGAVSVRGLGPGGTDVSLPIPQHRRARGSALAVGDYLIRRRGILAALGDFRRSAAEAKARRDAADRARWAEEAARGAVRRERRARNQAEVDSTLRLLGVEGHAVTARADELDRVELVFVRMARVQARDLVLLALERGFIVARHP